MREQNFGIRFRIATLEIWRDLVLIKNIRQGFAPDDTAFTQRALAAGWQFFRAPDFYGELPHLLIAHGKIFHAGRLRRWLAHHRSSGFQQIAEFAEQFRAHRRQLGQDQHAIADAMRDYQAPVFHG